MNFPGVLFNIQTYFREWLERTGGVGAYTTFTIDLSVSHDNERFLFTGDQIIIIKSDSTAYIRLNDRRNENIDTTVVGGIHTPFKEFFITNEANTGFLEILVGTEGIFSGIKNLINVIITDPEDSRGNFHQVGNAELACRLGSIDTFDKRGNVILMDDFDCSTLKWIKSYSGADSDVYISNDYAVQGSCSCKLISGVASAPAGIVKYIHPQILGRIGMEFSFTVDSDTNSVSVNAVYSDGSNEYTYVLTYNHVSNNIIINGVTVNDSAFILESGYVTFHTFKFVFDTNNHKPVRLLINEYDFDISNTAVTVAGSSNSYLKMSVTHISTGLVDPIYIDNVIITQNEP